MGELRSNTDMIDVSLGGTGGPIDNIKKFVEGARRFYHGDTEINEGEFERLMPTHSNHRSEKAGMTALQAQKIIDAMYLEAAHMDIVTNHALSVVEIHEFLDWINDLIERQP